MTRTVLVCTNTDCEARGSFEVLDGLNTAADAADLDVEVRDYLCFSACEFGPHVVVVEDRVWYSAVRPEDVAAIALYRLTDGQDPPGVGLMADKQIRNVVFTMLDAGLFPGQT